jgi:uncharacterized protein (UPF0332 family)
MMNFEILLGKEIIKSESSFKIKLFLERAENSLVIAKHHKDKTIKDVSELHQNYWAITISYYSILYAAKALILTKGYEVKTHIAAQIALETLCVPSDIEKEDLLLLDQAHKILENEYITYFEDSRKESHIARYSSIKKYEERRVEEIFENARKFILKIKLILS